MGAKYPQMMLEDPQPMAVTLEPLDDCVVIETVDEETETRAGLIIPASSDTGCQPGMITAVGTEGHRAEPGDKVLFPKGPACDVRLPGSAVNMMPRGELIA